MAKKFIVLKKEILGIKDLKGTVKSLEKISAANLHHLKITTERMKEYEKALKNILFDILEEKPHNLLFRKPKTKRKLNVILSIEKGLAGSLLNKLLDFFEINLNKKEDEVLVVGERGKRLLKERGIKVDYFFSGQKEIPREKDIRKIKDYIISQFLIGKYREVLIFFPNFKSFGIQQPSIFSFLPIDRGKLLKTEEFFRLPLGYLIYEPLKGEIIDYLIKEYLGMIFYQKILETKLSELSARTIFMEEASEKADNLIKNLFHQYFKLKREIVTKEITDLYSHRL